MLITGGAKDITKIPLKTSDLTNDGDRDSNGSKFVTQNSLDIVETEVTDLQNTIPNLATKDFVNSSIQTNTANFRGNWNTWATVPSAVNDYPADYAGGKTPTTNDYLVVQKANDYSKRTLVGT